MKKNLMSVIILALLVVNLVLTSVLMFTIYPQSKKANELITAVCNAIQLDLHSGAPTGLGNLPIDQITTYKVSEGADMTINLSGGGYAVVQVSLSVNNQSETFKSNGTNTLTNQESIIKDAINNIVRQYSKSEFLDNNDAVKREILKSLQQTFGADYIVGVTFPKVTTD